MADRIEGGGRPPQAPVTRLSGGVRPAGALPARPEVLVASDAHLDAARAEPGELVLQLGEARVAHVGRDRHLETRAGTGAQRILGDRLGGVGREEAHTLDLAARLAARRNHARPAVEGWHAGPHPRRVALAEEPVHRGPAVAVRA